MTDRERAIITAYTGVCMLAGRSLLVFYEYIEEIMGRPIWTYELAKKSVEEEIKAKSKADFIALCNDGNE